MKLLHLTKIATLASLLALSNISCAADPVKPATTAPSATYPSTQPTTTTPPRTNENSEATPSINYTTDKDGLIIPVDKNGKPFEQCSQEGSKNTCPLYDYKVNIRDIKTTVITEVKYQINPNCVQVCFEYSDQTPGRCFTKCSSQLPPR